MILVFLNLNLWLKWPQPLFPKKYHFKTNKVNRAQSYRAADQALSSAEHRAWDRYTSWVESVWITKVWPAFFSQNIWTIGTTTAQNLLCYVGQPQVKSRVCSLAWICWMTNYDHLFSPQNKVVLSKNPFWTGSGVFSSLPIGKTDILDQITLVYTSALPQNI